MKKLVVLIVSFCLFSSLLLAQGTVRGKISDENGETLIGVTVVLQSNKGIGTITDLDGNYTLKLNDTTEQTLVISYVSYQTTEEKVTVRNGEVIVKNIVLKSASKSLNVVEVTAKSVRSNEYYMENIKKKSANTIDYISSETMKRTGDNNVTAAVARVSGVSTNGSFITVRGIGDRYVKTTINGLRIPTLDPFTNNIKLDLFPSSLVDNIIITKTASPDLPSDWAGAYLSVETKDYPEKLVLSIESSLGYNNQTTFKEVLSTQTSKTDWLGYDNDFRNRSHENFTELVSPTQYQQLVALGLGDYYKSIGITGWQDGSAQADDFFKLGLVQLGLLEKALFNDPIAVAEAKNKYNNGTYKDNAYNIINADAAKEGQSFSNNWNTTKKRAPLNFSQSFSVGDQLTLFGKPLGFIAGFRYGSGIQYDPNSIIERTGNQELYPDGTAKKDMVLEQQFAKHTNGWSGLVNLAYKYHHNHGISLLFMPNLTGVNNVRDGESKNPDGSIYPYTFTKSQFYEQRKQMVYQLKSEHYFPTPKIKIELNASYTNGKSDVPDFKELEYFKDDLQRYVFDLKASPNPRRNYRYLSENVFDSKLAIEFPISHQEGLIRKIKVGAAYQNQQRDFNQYDYALQVNEKVLLFIPNNDIDTYFNLDKFGITTATTGANQIDLYYRNNTQDFDHTIGYCNITAAYAMLDYTIFSPLRISGGLRVEQTQLFTDVFLFDSLGLKENDGRRKSTGRPWLVNPGTLNTLNYLPSVNIIYKLKKDDSAPINLRLNYSQTLARPSIREYSSTIVRDFELNADVFGNVDLKMVEISNYDLRLESFFKSGNNASLSCFYKTFKNHVELISSNIGFTWVNAEKSNVLGVELEGKLAITKRLEFRANVAFVKSSTTMIENEPSIRSSDGKITWIPVDTVTRAMFGQAPYVLNGILSYVLDSIGLTTTITYNVQGPRLVLTSINLAGDIYELPRHALDFKISKKLGKHFNVSFTIRDILNAPVRRSYKYENGNKFLVDFDKYRYGTNYLLGISYKI